MKMRRDREYYIIELDTPFDRFYTVICLLGGSKGDSTPDFDLCRLHIPHNKYRWSYELALGGSVISIQNRILYDIRNFYSPELRIFSDMRYTYSEDYESLRRNPPIPI